MKISGYEVKSFPLSRRIIVDTARLSKRKHMMHGLLEFDVTEPRQLLRQYKQDTGESLSFTAFLIYCLGKALEMHKSLHAYRSRWGKLVIFDEVDVSTIIEIELEDHRFPLAHIIRRANKRSLEDIHGEIRSIQAEPSRSYGSQKRTLALFLRMPSFVRNLVYGLVLGNPHRRKQLIGTVGVTALGMFGSGGGWGIPLPMYNVNLLVGGIAEKPGVVDGRIEIREYLSVTLSFDHDIIDGAPAARFVQEFKTLIESGDGLHQLI